MRNVHLLPSNEASRLYFHNGMKSLVLTDKVIERKFSLDDVVNQHICITSSETIKKGNHVLHMNYKTIPENSRIFKAEFDDGESGTFMGDKIILTNIEELIKDGVQAIPDEFLEWFVKNPSCEEVKTESLNIGNGKLGYVICKPQIIISKEESKRKIDTCYNFNKETGCVQTDCRCEKEEYAHDSYINKNEYNEEDLKKAFEAGDLFRLYLDKHAVGLTEKDLPTLEEVLNTMNVECVIQKIKNSKK